MKALKHTLSNGLRVLVVPMPTLESATVTIWTGVGSRYEEERVAGISHFLEHMVFKGGNKYPTAKNISEAVDALGAEFNAGTSKDWTNFYIKARTGVVENAFDILSDMLLAPQLRPDDIERERGVIIEEMNMYEDTPMYRIGDIFDQLIFEGSALGRDIIGNKESVGKAITKDDFKEYRKRHYTADNLVVTVAGGVSEDQAVKLAEKYFGGLEKGDNKSAMENINVKQAGPKIRLIQKPIEQAHFIVGFLGNKLDSKVKYAESVLSTILGQGMSSRLFTEVREKRGLAYSVRMSTDHFIDTGSIATYAGVDVKKATEALKVILEQCYGLSDKSIPVEAIELQKAKDYIKGHIALSLENTKSVNNYFGYEEVLLGKSTTPEEDYAGIDSVTIDEVVTVAKDLFVPERLNLAIIGPFKTDSEFKKAIS